MSDLDPYTAAVLARETARQEAADRTAPPGWCSEHPGHELMTHRAADGNRGRYYYGLEDKATVCQHPDHRVNGRDQHDRERCRWCGGPLIPPGTQPWHVSPRRAYCKPNHRLLAYRAGQASSAALRAAER